MYVAAEYSTLTEYRLALGDHLVSTGEELWTLSVPSHSPVYIYCFSCLVPDQFLIVSKHKLLQKFPNH